MFQTTNQKTNIAACNNPTVTNSRASAGKQAGMYQRPCVITEGSSVFPSFPT